MFGTINKASGFQYSPNIVSPAFALDTICSLNRCNHFFHCVCIGSLLNSMIHTKFKLPISCTNCKAIYGVKTGDQPDTGTVDIGYDKSSLPAHYEFGTIGISYNFSDVVSQDGTHYYADGFPRFLEGKTVLELLRIAWNSGLFFTVGTIITTGRSDCIVWDNIHHKIKAQSNFSGHT